MLSSHRRDDERSVSPVIGIVLMVAITVILAAVIGTFVLNLSDNEGTAPQVRFTVTEGDWDNDDVVDNLTIRHESGEPVESGQLEIVVGDGAAEPVGDAGLLRTSDEIQVELTGSSTPAGDEVRVYWYEPGGGTDAFLVEEALITSEYEEDIDSVIV